MFREFRHFDPISNRAFPLARELRDLSFPTRYGPLGVVKFQIFSHRFSLSLSHLSLAEPVKTVLFRIVLRVIGAYPQIRHTHFTFTYRVDAHPAELFELSVRRIEIVVEPCRALTASVRFAEYFFSFSHVRSIVDFKKKNLVEAIIIARSDRPRGATSLHV